MRSTTATLINFEFRPLEANAVHGMLLNQLHIMVSVAEARNDDKMSAGQKISGKLEICLMLKSLFE
jgi:hypothetical protein